MRKYETVKNYADFVYSKLTHRGKIVVDVIEQKGYFTKFDLERFGVSADQGPRAVRDCKEAGIPIRTLNRVKLEGSNGRVSRYTFGKPEDIGSAKLKPKKYTITLSWQEGDDEVYKKVKELSKQTGVKAEKIAKSALKDLLM